MQRRPLLMAELSQFARFTNDDCVHGDVFLSGRLDVLADFLNQSRNVIEEQVAGEDGLRVYRQQGDQPLEPTRRQLVMRALQAGTNRLGVGRTYGWRRFRRERNRSSSKIVVQ
jgi:hypothetical protein